MISVNLNNLSLTEFWGENRPEIHNRSTFPLLGAMGTENSATVYFELDPGDVLGWHTDSVEELLLILAGTVEVFVGEEKGQLVQGDLALVPTMAPHNVRNVGQETARVLGFFGSNNFVATFDVPFAPAGVSVIDTRALTEAAAA
ncbi:MAG: cupin domain-containing protein [Anaerolineae bacterium]|nr:cupin domain-containing protein [Anaerolineae bacterium]